MKLNFENILIAIDQLINTIFGGMPDETISARIYRLKDTSIKYKMANIVINMVFFWQENHTFESYQSEKNRKQLPKEYN